MKQQSENLVAPLSHYLDSFKSEYYQDRDLRESQIVEKVLSSLNEEGKGYDWISDESEAFNELIRNTSDSKNNTPFDEGEIWMIRKIVLSKLRSKPTSVSFLNSEG